MRFRVRRDFVWEQRPYAKGEVVEIAENHPRINGLFMGRYIAYDGSNVPPDNGTPPRQDGPERITVKTSNNTVQTSNEQSLASSMDDSPLEKAIKAAQAASNSPA
jgi:hypothetical protein